MVLRMWHLWKHVLTVLSSGTLLALHLRTIFLLRLNNVFDGGV